MYSLRLICPHEEVDLASLELWEAGTVGIREIEGDDDITLIAGFEGNERRSELLDQFAAFAPEWHSEDAIDWIAVSHEAWQPREIGDRIFLAPHWSEAPTPTGRLRLVHNPGLACGTGEHPCTQLALIAIEKAVTFGCTLVDVGGGSGILGIAALHLGAAHAICADIDYVALTTARENFGLNDFHADLVCGSAECIAGKCADVTVANISGTVLLMLCEELVRITNRPGTLIVTGFPEAESATFQDLLPGAELSEIDGWCCITAKLS